MALWMDEYRMEEVGPISLPQRDEVTVPTGRLGSSTRVGFTVTRVVPKAVLEPKGDSHTNCPVYGVKDCMSSGRVNHAR